MFITSHWAFCFNAFPLQIGFKLHTILRDFKFCIDHFIFKQMVGKSNRKVFIYNYLSVYY